MRDRSIGKNNRRKGFTTVETIVVLVIILLMVGGISLGVVKWIDWTNFKRQNEYARTLFVAAENQLSEYERNGQLEHLSEQLENARTIDTLIEDGELTDSQGRTYSLESIWPESQNKGSSAHRYQGNIVSVIATAEDYALYMKDKEEGTHSLEEEKIAMYDLLYSYLYDPTILKATVCVEFVPEEGQVFSVLYSDKKTNFTYETQEEGGEKGIASIRNRESSFRKKRMVGYYGVDSLSQATSSKVEKPSLSAFRLNNEETLNLSFVVKKAEIGELNYELTVNDKTTKRPVLSFQIDGSRLKNEAARETVRCEVTRYTYEGEESVAKTSVASFPIFAWTSVDYDIFGNANPMIHVVLDGADLDASSDTFASYIENYEDVLGNNANTDLGGFLGGFADTMSFHRFGVNTEDIYCTVVASGEFYKTSAKKQSNSENTYFASYREGKQESGQSEIRYGLKNARHLYNIRYIEDYGEDTSGMLLSTIYGRDMSQITYEIEEDMDWESFQSDCHALFQSGVEVGQDKIESFPSIKLLRKTAAMKGGGTEKYTIRGLQITGEEAAGLFLCNEGILSDFILDDITVTGRQNVGAFCGVNCGVLEKLTVKNTGNKSVITGIRNVGGIVGAAGSADKDDNTVYEELENYGAVFGDASDEKNTEQTEEEEQPGKIGGIIGSVNSDETKTSITVTKCKNYGQIRALDSDVVALGGIVGQCIAGTQSILLTECISSPWYTEEEKNEILKSEDGDEIKGLKGECVGGIVGWNKGAVLRDCTTRKYGDKEGYVFGDRFVGGIIGYCESIDGKEIQIDGGENGVNEAHVLGNSFVGGIVGENQDGSIISNWKNRGFVGATENYSGGITGWNAGAENPDDTIGGEIVNCSSAVPNSEAVRALAGSELFVADFAGGIAGYNDGVIYGEKTLSMISNVTGGNFVGGIVGYNDMDGDIHGVKVTGGYVKGTGSFVGGYVGLNTSVKILMGEDGARYLESNPNQVEGNNCVGGTIGANIVAADKNISTIFYSDNFLGKLKASGAMAGGFIGYNRLLKGNGSEKNHKEKMLQSAKNLAKNLDDLETAFQIADPDPYFDRCLDEYGTSDYSFIIQGKENLDETQAKFGGIQSEIYVGGVMGYNDTNTKLRVKNVVNFTPVKASEAVENEKEQKNRKDYKGDSFLYSYAGGIIGKVNKNTVIDGCRNQDAGNNLVTKGTYTGGICEINEGLVKNCQVSNLGSRTMDYVGGIAGLNKGTIQGTGYTNRTITGCNYVGGITAENLGTITETKISGGKVRSYGSLGIAGGITAVNGLQDEKTWDDSESGIIYLDDEIEIFVQAEGAYAGGVAGINYGSLKQNQEATTQSGETTKKAVVKGTVKADSYAGGVIGDNQAEIGINNYRNEADVTVKEGYAGGIVASTKGNISFCENCGQITAQKKGYAGGIVARNKTKCVVQDCENTGGVSAQNGFCGGITAVNEPLAEILRCSVSGGETYESRQKAGGICGSNQGKIENSQVSAIQIRNLENSTGSMLGGITGENTATGTILTCSVGVSIAADKNTEDDTAMIRVKSLASDVYMGGVVGVNSGVIQGDFGKTKVCADLSFASQTQNYYGNMGGIAGTNYHLITGYVFRGNVQGTGNNPQNTPQYNPNTDEETGGAKIYGYGGIVGVNASSAGTIENCKVEQAEITGLGDANNVVNLGGIAGVNEKGAVIRQVSFGGGAKKYHPHFESSSTSLSPTVKTTGWESEIYVGTGSSSNAYGHSGGVAGLNSGTIEHMDEEAVKDSTVLVENYRGHVGGIVGYNRRTGKIDDVETGKNWLVFAPQSAQDNGCGGIIGYQAGEYGLTNCKNRATVVKTVSSSNAVGGIIGRMEVATSSNFLIQNCENYGTIDGYRRTGGIIGVWKYYGGTVSDCENYGRILNRNSEGSAGIVGCFYGLRSEVTIQRCANHGEIWGNSDKNCGGIVGNSMSGKVELYLSDCMNTGLIRAGLDNSGICAISQNISANSMIVRCKNYGYAFSGSSEKLSGIAPQSLTTDIKVEQCFNFSDISYPIMKNSGVNQKENYYLTKEFSENQNIEDTFYVTKIDAPGIINGSRLYKTVMNPESFSESDRAYFSYSTKEQSYTFTFSRPLELNSMELYWNRGLEGRVQNYSVYYRQLDTEAWKLYENVDNITSSQRAEIVKNEKEIVDNGTVTASQIKIVITGSVKNGTNNPTTFNINSCLCRIKWNGTVNGKMVKGYQGMQNSDGTYSLDEGMQRQSTTTGVAFTKKGPATEKGIGEEFTEESNEDGTFRLVKSGNYQLGFSGFSESVLVLFDEDEAKTDSSLTLCGDEKDNLRYVICQKDDSYFTTNTIAKEEIVVGIPDLVTVSEEKAGLCHIAWNLSSNAQYYEYEVFYQNDAGETVRVQRDIVYGNSVDISLGSSNEDNIVQIAVRLRAGRDVSTSKGPERCWSDWSGEVIYDKLSAILPTPEYHLELLFKDGALTYQAVLDNQEEYRTFLRENGVSETEIQKELDNIIIVIQQDNTERYRFSVAKEKSDEVYDGIKEIRNTILISCATSEDNRFRASADVSRETMIPHQNLYLAEKNMANVCLASTDGVENVGFHGDTFSNLNYQIKIQCNKDYNFNCYMHSEMMAVDQSLGVPVALASSELRISDTTTNYITSKLSPLPEDFLDESVYSQRYVRSFPALLSNHVVYNGHTAWENMTKEELLQNWYVTKDHSLTKEDTGELLIQDVGGEKKLSDGFDLQLNADGTYNIYYNALLEYFQKNAKENSDITKKTVMYAQVFEYQLPENKNIQNAPVIHVNDSDKDGTDGDVNTKDLLIYWDLEEESYIPSGETWSNYKVGAIYDYRITGITSDGVQVNIDDGTFVTKEGEENKLIYNTESWNYRQVEIAITRRGEMDENERTLVFPGTSLLNISLKDHLSQVSKPEVSLHLKEDGQVEKDSLLYDVKWENIPAEQRNSLAGFEITARSTQREKEETWNMLLSEEEREQNTLCYTIPLDQFDREETIAISIKALAVGEEYQNSMDGVEAEMTLPGRLYVPIVSRLTIEPSMAYGEDTFLTQEQIAKGLTLSYSGRQSLEEVQGNYQLAVAIFDEKQEADQNEVPLDGDHQEKKDGCWNEGALLTLYLKDSPLEMSGNLSEGEVILQDEALKDYGGKWLKIAMRSVSDNAISSWWSDEDDDGMTENYCWIQIPRIQVQAPSVRTESNLLYYNEEGEMDVESETALAISQTALEFDINSHADGYGIQLIRKSKDSIIFQDNKATTRYVDWITFHKSGDGYRVMFATTDPLTQNKSSTDWSNTNVTNGGEGQTLGILRPGEKLFLPITGNVAEYAGAQSEKIATVAWLSLIQKDGQSTIVLQLPDGEEVNGVAGGFEEYADLYTRQVTIQPLVTGNENKKGYESGKIIDWYRKNNEEFAQTEMDASLKMPATNGFTLHSSEREGIPYEIRCTANEWCIYQIRVKDAASQVVEERLVSAYGFGTSTIYTTALLPETCRIPVNGTLEVRAAAVLDPGGVPGNFKGGLSQWNQSGEDWTVFHYDELMNP